MILIPLKILLIYLLFSSWLPYIDSSRDCVDATLRAYPTFEALGFEPRIAIGNLEQQGESITECDHCWLLVTDEDGHTTAIDWGRPYYDEQHFEGYRVPLKYLQRRDKKRDRE